MNHRSPARTARGLHRIGARLVAIALLVVACNGATPASSPGGGSAVPTASTAPAASAAGSDATASLLAAAKQEGSLTTIALPHFWCNYGEAIETFKRKYDLDVNELNPDAGDTEQLDAIRANRDSKGPGAPDVIDVSPAAGRQAAKEKLLDPFKVSTWDEIPKTTKDPAGNWYGDYYGVLAFETNRSVVGEPPADWKDLLAPAHKGQVALAGDPRIGAQAIQTVLAAALASGGSLDDATAGLTFFKKLKDAGNLLPSIASPSTIEGGTTPITIRWSYNALSHRESTNGAPEIDVTIPAKGRLAGSNVQAISAFAPHPNAARLWMEFLYSDEGQNILLTGHCLPIRLGAMLATDQIPAEVLAKLPDTEGAVFPTIEQAAAAATLISTKWDSVVGVDIK